MTQVTYMDTRCFCSADVYASVYFALSETRRKKCDAYKFDKDRFLSLGAGYLLAVALKGLGISEKSAVYGYGSNEKPYIVGESAHFNLSHSGTVAVCAVSDGEVGIDVEALRPVEESLLRHVCTAGEAAFLNALPAGERAAEFIRLWTVKESYIKYVGKGLSQPLGELEMSFSSPTAMFISGKKQCVHFASYELDGYKITVCGKDEDFPAAIKEITIDKGVKNGAF